MSRPRGLVQVWANLEEWDFCLAEDVMKTKVAKKVVSLENGTVSFMFTNGQTLVCSMNELNEEMKRYLILHGISQTVGDSYSNAKENGGVDWASQQAGERWNSLLSGTINRRGGSQVTDLAQALSEVMDVELEAAVEKVQSLDSDQKKALSKHPAVQKVLLRLKAERLAKQAKNLDSEDVSDLDELLS